MAVRGYIAWMKRQSNVCDSSVGSREKSHRVPARRAVFSWQKRFVVLDPHVVARVCSQRYLESGHGAHPEKSRAAVARDLHRTYLEFTLVVRVRVDHIFPRFFTVSSLTVQRIAAIAFLLFLPMICVHHDDLETTDGATCLFLFIHWPRAKKWSWAWITRDGRWSHTSDRPASKLFSSIDQENRP